MGDVSIAMEGDCIDMGYLVTLCTARNHPLQACMVMSLPYKSSQHGHVTRQYSRLLHSSQGPASMYSSGRSSTRPLREYPLTHSGSSAMHLLASSIAAAKAPSCVWHAARLLYAARQGRGMQRSSLRKAKIIIM